MAEAYALPTSSMGKISRWYNAKKAAGQTVQPWELESAYTGEMNSLMGRQTANRGLSLQAARDAEAALMNAEARRMNTVNTRLTEDQIEAGEKASYANLAGTLGGTAGLYYLMKPGADAAALAAAKLAAAKLAAAQGTATAAQMSLLGGPAAPILKNMAGGAQGVAPVITAGTVPPPVPVDAVVPEMLGMPGAPTTTTGLQVGKGLTEGALETGGTGSGLTGINEAMGAGVSLEAAPGLTTGLSETAGMTAEQIAAQGAPYGYGAPATAGIPGWAGPAALAAVGLRAIGKNQTNDLQVLQTPITGIGELGTKYLGDTTGIKEISEVGRWLPRLEEKAWTGIETGIGKVVDVVSNIVKGTWLCTEVARYIGLTDDDNKDLQKLRRYCIKNHRDWIKEYLDKGKRLIEAINEAIGAKGDRMIFYADLKRDMVYPVIDLVKQGKEEEAFVKYRDVSFDLFDKYTPGLITLKR